MKYGMVKQDLCGNRGITNSFSKKNRKLDGLSYGKPTADYSTKMRINHPTLQKYEKMLNLQNKS